VSGLGGERGQASAELVAGVPALALAALVALQLLAVGHAASLADGAAEAGGRAPAAGGAPPGAGGGAAGGPAARPAEAGARAALPGWARDRVEVEVSGGRVAVALRPPAALPGAGKALTVRSSAWARPAPGGR